MGGQTSAQIKDAFPELPASADESIFEFRDGDKSGSDQQAGKADLFTALRDLPIGREDRIPANRKCGAAGVSLRNVQQNALLLLLVPEHLLGNAFQFADPVLTNRQQIEQRRLGFRHSQRLNRRMDLHSIVFLQRLKQ